MLSRLIYYPFLVFYLSSFAYSQWFWSEHYYEIRAKGQSYHSKGKPEIEGEFTVFKKWPENLEWRIKTDDIRSIKDIGPLSPEELEAKANAERARLLAIFAPIISLKENQEWLTSNQEWLTSSELKTARERDYSDDEIWSKLNESSACYLEARQSGFSLDQIAEFLDSQRIQFQ